MKRIITAAIPDEQVMRHALIEPAKITADAVPIQYNLEMSYAELFNLDPDKYDDLDFILLCDKNSFKLSNRTRHALSNAQLTKFKDLLLLTPPALSKINNLGAKSLNEIEQAFKLLQETFDLPVMRHAPKQIEKNTAKRYEFASCSEAKYADILGIHPEFCEDISFQLLCEKNSIELSNRTKHALGNAELTQFTDILLMRPSSLVKVKNLGKKSVAEIESALQFMISNNCSAISPDKQKSKNIDAEKIRAKVIANLNHDTFLLNNLNELELDYYYKMLAATKTFGKEISLNLLSGINREKTDPIIASFKDFCEKIFLHQKIISSAKEASETWKHLPDNKLLQPYLELYALSQAKQDLSITAVILKQADTITIDQYKQFAARLSEQNEINNLELYSWLTGFQAWLSGADLSIICRKLFEPKEVREQRFFKVISARSSGETLEKIGLEHAITRERIRQIESKTVRIIRSRFKTSKYNVFSLISAFNNGSKILQKEDLCRTIGTKYGLILWHCATRAAADTGGFALDSDFSAYHKKAKLIIVFYNKAEQETFAADYQTAIEIINRLPDLILTTDLDSLLKSKASELSIAEKIFLIVKKKVYSEFGQFSSKGHLTLARMYEYILKNRFQNGYKIADEYESAKFKRYLVDLFAKNTTSITGRSIDARIGIIGVLCDRGKYIHPDYMQVDQKILDIVNNYIERSNRRILPFGEIFEDLKNVFAGTQITNRYSLQGALKKYGCAYKTGKDFIIKDRSASFADELDAFVADRGITDKSTILAEFTSLSEASLGQIVARCPNVLNIDRGNYIHASQFDLQPKDYKIIRSCLSEACKKIPVNTRRIYKRLFTLHPDFMYRNNIDVWSKLYAILYYMFKDEFKFSRPYIAKLGTDNITNRNVILQHLAGFDTIEIEELIDICNENSLKHLSLPWLCQALAPDFLRINQTTLMRSELVGVTPDIVKKTAAIIREMLKPKGYIACSTIDDYLWFPEVNVEWNEFLLESILNISKQLNIISLLNNPLNHSTALYVADSYKDDTLTSFMIKILTREVEKGTFNTKVEMRNWLKENGLIENKLPNYLESAKYFYIDGKGVRCSNEQTTLFDEL